MPELERSQAVALKDRLKQQMISARDMSERLLTDFKTPEQWTFQVHPGANHALWFAGHMGQTDNFFMSLINPAKRKDQQGWAEHFGTGSQPTSNPEDYPSIEDVLSYMRERRETFLELLDSLDEKDLDTATPAGSPDFLGDYAMVFQAAAWHEGLHAGQLSVCRRALGHQPVFGG